MFEGGALHVRKDGSGYIVVAERDFALEDDRQEGPDGPEGSVHWIARFPAGEMIELRDFLNGQQFARPPQPSVPVAEAALTDLRYLANELSWDRRTRDISDRIIAALRALKGEE